MVAQKKKKKKKKNCNVEVVDMNIYSDFCILLHLSCVFT